MKYTTKTTTILAALCSASVLLLSSCNDSTSTSSSNEDTTEDNTTEPAVPSIPESLANTNFINPSYNATPSAGTFSIESIEITSSDALARTGSANDVETGTFNLSGRGRTSSSGSTTSYNYSNIPFTYYPSTGEFVSGSCTLTGSSSLTGTFTINLKFDIAANGNVPVSGSMNIKYDWLSPATMIIDEASWAINKQD